MFNSQKYRESFVVNFSYFHESISLSSLFLPSFSVLIKIYNNMWIVLFKRGKYFNSQLGKKNAQFFDRVKSHQKKFKIHEKAMHIKQQDINKWTASQSKKQLTEKIVKEGDYDFDLKKYISKFNEEHKGRINLLDFSHYATKFNDFKDNPISKKDMEIVREFQKRKIDQRLHNLATARDGKQQENYGALENPLQYYEDVNIQLTNKSSQIQAKFSQIPQGKHIEQPKFKKWFDVDDDFMMILLERNTSTKVTTLNRINYYRYLLFMGNGNGLISYGKSRDLTPQGALTKAIIQCKKNIIAVPLDHTCTMPRAINSRFQDYHIYLRPLPGFNSWGYPSFSLMLALSGISHVGFKVLHSGHNNYTLLHSFFKAVTQNTTPQDMAQLQGFKLYRHRFIRPLTEHDDKRHHLSR